MKNLPQQSEGEINTSHRRIAWSNETHDEKTREFLDELENLDLFRPGTVTITNESGEKFNLRGFRIVDETKFNALPDDAFLEFRRKGWLHAITSHLVSIQNLAALGFRSKTAE